jgi:hypothetical protein
VGASQQVGVHTIYTYIYVVQALIGTIKRIMNYKSADYCHNLWQYMTSEVLTMVITKNYSLSGYETMQSGRGTHSLHIQGKSLLP